MRKGIPRRALEDGKPMSVAGLTSENMLGVCGSEAHSIDVYAIVNLRDLRKRLSVQLVDPSLSLPGDSFCPTGHPVVPTPPPLPARPMRSSNLEKRSIPRSVFTRHSAVRSFPQPQRLADSGTFGQAGPACSTFPRIPFAFRSSAAQSEHYWPGTLHRVGSLSRSRTSMVGNVVAWSSYRDQ